MPSPDGPDKLLFTPGPLTTSRTVKEAMLRDVGSRDAEFLAVVADVRARLLALAGVSRERGYEAVLVQGSGTYGLESVISSAIPREGGLLALVNGAYGERLARMAEVHGIALEVLRTAEDRCPEPREVAARLARRAELSHVALVHCETTTGILNPVEAIGTVVENAGRAFLVDSMSSFGVLELDLERAGVAFLVSSANKCLEGVPGCAFVIARRSALQACEGRARTLALDLFAQWQGLDQNGQFRFTPPTHALLAFHRALRELEDEGGPAARLARYRANHRALVTGMRALGFRVFLPEHVQAPIITSFRYPEDPRFRFEDFYDRLSARGFLVYPGKLQREACFRIGNIGRIGVAEIEALVAAVGGVLEEMGVALPVSRA